MQDGKQLLRPKVQGKGLIPGIRKKAVYPTQPPTPNWLHDFYLAGMPQCTRRGVVKSGYTSHIKPALYVPRNSPVSEYFGRGDDVVGHAGSCDTGLRRCVSRLSAVLAFDNASNHCALDVLRVE